MGKEGLARSLSTWIKLGRSSFAGKGMGKVTHHAALAEVRWPSCSTKKELVQGRGESSDPS